jgi:hypothetical protein
VLRSKKRFLALREFTLEGGKQELERQAVLRKEQQEAVSQGNTRPNSADGVRSPTGLRSPSLSNVPEEHQAFAIGDDEDTDDDMPPPRATATPVESSRASISSSAADETLPTQLRGMSEKARGKMPAGQGSFSRVNSISSVQSWAPVPGQQFQPTPEWVSLGLSWVDLVIHWFCRLKAGNQNCHFTPSYPSSLTSLTKSLKDSRICRAFCRLSARRRYTASKHRPSGSTCSNGLPCL